MKTNIKIIAAMTLVLIMASCKNKDDRMLTVINADGTCSREYTFHSTQQWLGIPPEEDYDSIVDKTWERSWSVLGADSVRYPVPMTEAQLDSMQALDNSRPLGNMLICACIPFLRRTSCSPGDKSISRGFVYFRRAIEENNYLNI